MLVSRSPGVIFQIIFEPMFRSGGQSMKTLSARNTLFLSFLSVVLILGVAPVAPSGVLAADSDAHDEHGINHASMGMVDNYNEPWAQKLKAQTVMEDVIEGRPNRAS